MSSEQGTSTGSTGGPAGSGTQHQNTVNQITHQQNISAGKDYVKDKLGLTNVTQTPVDAPPITTDMTATNLTGKDKKFYGQEASQATDDWLVKTGNATVGNYFKKVGGEFIRISKTEGEKLYAAGDPSISRSIRTTSKGHQMKYGQSGGAMGSGDPSGILSSTAISKPMWQSQKNLQQMIGLGMLAVGAPMAGSMIYQSGKGSYNKYIDSFYNQQSSTSISQNTYTTGNISNGEGNASDSVGTSTLDKSFSDTLVQDTSTKQKQIKLAMANQEIGEDKRTFLKANKRTITAGMSTV
tara:strand:+ start:4262 stop:5149 length:888 start_codon:yes stop_codon:yes gene_type:complete